MDEKKINIVAVLILAVIVIAAVFFFVYSQNPYTGTYETITAEEALDIINSNVNLTIVDVRGLDDCNDCQFNVGHLPNASSVKNAVIFYNSTKDIIVYSKDGSVGEEFCDSLIGHVYGKVYNIKGGYDAWEGNNFPTTSFDVYTSSFQNVSVDEAYYLINTTENLTIIDCRGLEGCSTCQFNRGHLPGADLNDNPTTLYNAKTGILAYSKNGTVGADFCSDLVDHVYGRIYNLQGGWESWSACSYCPK